MVIKPGRMIVDLRKSKIDEKLSDPKSGKYVFLEKVYIKGKNHSEDKFFSWCRNRDTDVTEWRLSYGFETVKAVVDPYWPEGITPAADGVYVKGDLVLVMCPIELEIRRRVEEEQMGKRQQKAQIDKLKAETKAAGADVDGLVDDTFQL